MTVRTTAKAAKPLLDALVDAFPDSSKTTLRKMLQNGRVRVDGQVEKDAKRLIEPGETIDVGERVQQRVLPPTLDILHEDDDIIVVFKSAGLLSVATEREKEQTAQAYLNVYLESKGLGRIHVVHRLDRETSGVMMFAKNFDVRQKLKDLFASHDIDRVYVAVVEGSMNPPDGSIRSYLLERKDLRMVSVDARPDAKLAITHYRTIATSARHSMLEVTLETGRKNQIRAHLVEAGHPVAGDQLYGATTNPLGRLGLHAKLLGFVHPTTGETMSFTAPIPKQFRDLFVHHRDSE